MHHSARIAQVADPLEPQRTQAHRLGKRVGALAPRQTDHDPHVIEIIPSDVLERRYRAGADSEAE